MKTEEGFTYLLMLFAVAIAGAILATGSVYWSQFMQREREADLINIGHEYRRAIGLYYERSPGGIKRYPNSLSDLIADPRHPTIQRYLRKNYKDPMSNSDKWGIVAAPEGGIMGIYSLSTLIPIKQGNFSDVDSEFSAQRSYSGWRFVYAPLSSLPSH